MNDYWFICRQEAFVDVSTSHSDDVMSISHSGDDFYNFTSTDQEETLFYFFRKENGEFEALDLTPYSSPPDLPDVMKSQDTNGQEQVSLYIWVHLEIQRYNRYYIQRYNSIFFSSFYLQSAL